MLPYFESKGTWFEDKCSKDYDKKNIIVRF